MANPKAPLSEAELRAARDEMIGRVAHQQKRFGMVPNIRAAEDFVNPIAEKIARDHDRAIEKSKLAPKSPPRINREGVKVQGGPTLGAVDFATGATSAGLAQTKTPREMREAAFARRIRLAVRELLKDPVWRERMRLQFMRKCDAGEREVKVREVVFDWLKANGRRLVRIPRERKIMVGG
jgi:hypothetical protein